MLTFALFPIVLFFLGAVLVTGLPVAASVEAYFKNRGRQSVICPDSGQAVNVGMETNSHFAPRSAARNIHA